MNTAMNSVLFYKNKAQKPEAYVIYNILLS